jgi:hypothetical protein
VLDVNSCQIWWDTLLYYYNNQCLLVLLSVCLPKTFPHNFSVSKHFKKHPQLHSNLQPLNTRIKV